MIQPSPYEEAVFECVRVCSSDITLDTLRNGPPASVMDLVEGVVNEAVMRWDEEEIVRISAHIPYPADDLARYRNLTEVVPHGGDSPEMERLRHNLVAALFADTWPAARSIAVRSTEAFLTGIRRVVVRVSPHRGLRFHDIQLAHRSMTHDRHLS